MINYKKIEKIAQQLEEMLVEDSSLQTEIEKRTEIEKENTDIPEPSIEAAKYKNVNLNIKRQDLNKLVSNDMANIMKSTAKFNDAMRDGNNVTLNQAIREMKAWGANNNVKIDFPNAILNKTIGSCNAAWLIKLGPMIANMLNKYQHLKHTSVKDNNDEF